MDAAHKLIKTTSLLFAVGLLMAAPGWAVTLNVTSTVTLSGAGGQDVSVTSSASPTTEITYTIAKTYAGDNGGVDWLGITGGTTTPATLSFSLFRTAGLPSGTHTATVVLTPTAASGAAAVAITVSYTSGSSGGGTLTADQNPITLSTASGNLVTTTVTISTTSATAVTLDVTPAVASGGVAWLTANINGASSVVVNGPTTILVTATAFSLPASTTPYVGSVTVTPATGTALVIPVNFTVTGTGVGNGTWAVSPTSLAFSFTTNGTLPNAFMTVTTNSGANTYNATTNSTAGWLLVNGATSANGLFVGSQVGLAVGPNANLLSAGFYTGTVSINDLSGNLQATVTVNLTVNGGNSAVPVISPNPLILSSALNGPQQTTGVTVTSSTGGLLSVSGSLPSWITVGSLSNTTLAAGGSIVIPLNVNPGGLGAGQYPANFTVTVGSQSTTATVNLTVGGGTGTGTTAVAPTSLVFTYESGTPQSALAQPKIVVTGPAGSWTSSVTTLDGGNWLQLSPGNGSTFPDPSFSPTVILSPVGLAVGGYSGNIAITTGAGTQNVSVSLTVTQGAALVPTPGSLVFVAATATSTPAGQTVFFSATDLSVGTLAITATANSPWITVSATATSMSVTVSPAGLIAGVYSGSITINQNNVANSPYTFPVLLVVGAGGGGGSGGGTGNVTVSPASLTFSGQSGATSLATQTIAVSSASGAAPVPFTVTPSTTSGGTWLSTNASGNATPSTITVTANPSGLAAGTYTGNLAIQPNGGTLVNVPVTLTITALATVSALPTSLTFNYRAGDSTPAAQTIAVAGTGLTFSATAVSTGNWLVVSPASGTAPGAVSVTINPAGLVAGSYSGTVTIAGTGGAAGTTVVNVSLTVTVPLPTVTKVTNAGSFATGTIAPGEIITLFAVDPTHPIGPTAPAGLTLDSTGKVSTTIGGVQVLVNGLLCPMVFANATQVSAVVPYEVAQLTGTAVNVLVKFLGQTSNGVAVNVVTTAPGLFTANSSGTGPGAILNSNNSFNAPNNPAARGDTVVVYLTGEGQTSPAGVTGKVTTLSATPPLTPGPLLQVSILVGGQPANFSFAGEAPGFVSGAMQLNVQIPTNIGTGEQEILVTIGGNQSQKGVTVSVK